MLKILGIKKTESSPTQGSWGFPTQGFWVFQESAGMAQHNDNPTWVVRPVRDHSTTKPGEGRAAHEGSLDNLTNNNDNGINNND